MVGAYRGAGNCDSSRVYNIDSEFNTFDQRVAAGNRTLSPLLVSHRPVDRVRYTEFRQALLSFASDPANPHGSPERENRISAEHFATQARCGVSSGSLAFARSTHWKEFGSFRHERARDPLSAHLVK